MTDIPTQLPVSEDFKRVAIVDDVFLGPTLSSVKRGLVEFCAFVESEDELPAVLSEKTGCDFRDPQAVDEPALRRLHEAKHQVDEAREPLTELFTTYDQRRGDVDKIVVALTQLGFEPQSFGSISGLLDGEDFNLVFLDYYLENDNESKEIAQKLFRKFRSFIVLMSDKPDPAEYRDIEEDFRRKSYLLRGFFSFVPKGELTDHSGFEKCLDRLPKNATVCKTVQSFVDSIDLALGGPIEEVSSNDGGNEAVLSEFMRTLRSLALHDYAVLCELTLRDEGHPLGDYLIRLLGTFLMQQLMREQSVVASIKELDFMRFDEFLPFVGDTSDALRELYAASISEPVASPWGNHPWEAIPEKPKSENDNAQG